MRFAPLLLAAGLGLVPQLAHASIESMGNVRSEDRNCRRPHEQQALWRPSNGAIRLAGPGTRRFEFYGHGVDLTRDVRLSGITGGSARAFRGVGGVANGARGCGNIGSLVVEITLPEVGSANAGTLNIGSERLAIRALPLTLGQVSWHPSNIARPGSGRSTATAGSGSAPSTAGIVGSTSGQACLPPTCNPNQPGSTFVVLPGNSQGGVPPYRSVGHCVAQVGGTSVISNNTTLIISLPARRNAQAMANCATYDAPLDVRYTAVDADAFMSELAGARSVPMPTMTATGPGIPAFLSCHGNVSSSRGRSVRRCHLNNGIGPVVKIPRETLQTVTSSQRQTLELALAGSTRTLTLVVQVAP